MTFAFLTPSGGITQCLSKPSMAAAPPVGLAPPVWSRCPPSVGCPMSLGGIHGWVGVREKWREIESFDLFDRWANGIKEKTEPVDPFFFFGGQIKMKEERERERVPVHQMLKERISLFGWRERERSCQD